MGHPEQWLHRVAGGAEAKLYGFGAAMGIAVAVEFGMASVEVGVERGESFFVECGREWDVDLEGLALIAHGDGGGECDVGRSEAFGSEIVLRLCCEWREFGLQIARGELDTGAKDRGGVIFGNIGEQHAERGENAGVLGDQHGMNIECGG